MRSAENPTPTWFRFQQLDSASEEIATSSSLGRPTRIQFLQIPSRLQIFQKFLKNPQCSSSQVAKLPVQWMPFPQYPLRSRMKILLQELLDILEYPEEVPKEFHPQDLDYRSDILRVQTLLFHKGRCCDMGQNDTIGKIELKIIFRLAVGISNSKNDIQLFLQLFDELRVNGDYH